MKRDIQRANISTSRRMIWLHRLDQKTNLISSAVIIVVVGGNARDDLDPFLCSSFFHCGHIIWVNCGRFLGNFVDEKVCVVVASDGDGDDLHLGGGGGGKGSNRQTDRN